jgi:acetyl esterase/lipase
VPIGYLVGVAVIGLGTWFALVPPRWGRAFGRMSFLFGPVVNELPFLAIYLLVISTLPAVAEGNFDVSGAIVALALAALTATGLGVVIGRALQTSAVVERALDEGLGSGWRSGVDAARGAHANRRLPIARILLAPLFLRVRDVQRIANVSYGDAGSGNRLDVYRHRSDRAGGPVLIHLHGGHFDSGRKDREARPLLYRLASQGWLCISADYRLAPDARPLIDAKKAIAWAHEHAAAYGGDSTRVFVAGSSAGAHLAAMSALTPREPAFQPGFEDADTSIAAAICLGGYYGNALAGTPSSPLDRVGADAPPFFLAHGDRDTLAPMKGAQRLTEELRKATSSPVVYAVLPGGHHTFDLVHSIRFDSLINGIESFTDWVISHDGDGEPRGLRRGSSWAPGREDRISDC